MVDDAHALHSATPVPCPPPYPLPTPSPDPPFTPRPVALGKKRAKADHSPSQKLLSVFTTQKAGKPEQLFIPSVSGEHLKLPFLLLAESAFGKKSCDEPRTFIICEGRHRNALFLQHLFCQIISHKHQEEKSTTSLSEHLMLFIHWGHFSPT